MTRDGFTIQPDLAWPWSLPGFGWPALALVAAALMLLTLWTYVGVPGAGRRRVSLLMAIRLAALALACLAVVRPSLAVRDSLKLPSTLIFLLDGSESMTIQDEFNNQSRWDTMRRTLGRSEPTLQQLREEQNVTIYMYRFAGDVKEYDPQGKADGKRTDFLQALTYLRQKHSGERNLRGLIICSDGAHNGPPFRPDDHEADKWRALPCPIFTFSLGQRDTSSKQRDISLVGFDKMKPSVPIKSELKVTGIVNAPGFKNTTVRARLFVDDKEVASQEYLLKDEKDNKITLTTRAPEKPGEMKVTMRVDPQLGEVTAANNEKTTYVSVTKDGLAILYVEGKYRAFEPRFIRQALADPRIDLTYKVLLNDGPLSADEARLLKFEERHFDVVIIGDISAKRYSGGDPSVLKVLEEQVKKGTGLMMIGGYENFGNGTGDWRGTPIADLMPVQLESLGQEERQTKMVPTPEGLERYVMRLADNPADNQAVWDRLPKLGRSDGRGGYTRLGKPKDGATVLARAGDANGPPLLVSHTYGKGRTLAFGGDTTENWRNLGLPQTEEGVGVHARFWKQVVLWLAHQDEASSNVWITPDKRILESGEKLGFAVGARDQDGKPLKDVRFQVRVTGPIDAKVDNVPVTQGVESIRGQFTQTEEPGEYRMVVEAFVKDKKLDEASVRFLVEQNTAEMAVQAADLDFLKLLADKGGGKAFRMEELPRFLQELQPLPQNRPKTELYPDWRKSPPPNSSVGEQVRVLNRSGALYTFLLFVGLLCLEWFLRRSWGMV